MAQDETQTKDYLQPIAPHEEGVVEGAVVSVVEQAEINQQIATARRYPRSVSGFRRKLYEMVTIDTDTAESCIYAVPRDGKTIVGPSIRFAELLLIGWGNNRAATEVSGKDEAGEFIIAAGMFFDLESNSAIQAKVMRRIIGKSTKDFPRGKPFGPDMVATTGNAAASIALRNAILRGVPKALWNDIFEEARKVAAGDARTFKDKRDKVVKELGIQGATPDQIFQLLGVKGADDMTADHVVHLKGLMNAIRDNETTMEEAFGAQLKPGQVAPAQPARSDFTREEPRQTEQAQAQPQQAQAPSDEPKPETKAEERKPETVKTTAFDDWLSDCKKELDSLTKVRDVADLRDSVRDQLDGENLKIWDALCEAKTKAILDATRKGRGK